MSPENTDTRIIPSEFEPARWLRNRHAQTIYPSLPWAWRGRPALRRENLELPDGDTTAVDWLTEADSMPDAAPLVVILHGLEGSAESSYARMLMEVARDRGWRSCVLHFRDCGDYRNRLPRRYHAGETNDLRFFLNRLQAKRDGSQNAGPLLAVGYSLGGNVLLKYLGESGTDTPLSGGDGSLRTARPARMRRCIKYWFFKSLSTYSTKEHEVSCDAKVRPLHRRVRLGPGNERAHVCRI